jgi:hypothetical protein
VGGLRKCGCGRQDLDTVEFPVRGGTSDTQRLEQAETCGGAGNGYPARVNWEPKACRRFKAAGGGDARTACPCRAYAVRTVVVTPVSGSGISSGPALIVMLAVARPRPARIMVSSRAVARARERRQSVWRSWRPRSTFLSISWQHLHYSRTIGNGVNGWLLNRSRVNVTRRQ